MDVQGQCEFCHQPVKRKQQSVSANVRMHFCNNQCKGEYQRLAKPVTKEWLEQKYLVEKLDTSIIGRLVSRDPKSVWNWLKDFHIPTRGRGGHNKRVGGPKWVPCHIEVMRPAQIDLERWYREEWQSLATIAERLQVGETTVGRWLNHYQIPLRSIKEYRARDGRVPYLKNGVHHLKGKRGVETPNWKGGITPERQAFYRSEEWRMACITVWRRAKAYCERCGEKQRKKDRGTYHIHHVISFKVRELRGVPTNLLLLCSPCHRFVHSKVNVHKEYLGEVS